MRCDRYCLGEFFYLGIATLETEHLTSNALAIRLYLAVVMDLFSRRIVGWSIDSSMTLRSPSTELPYALAIILIGDLFHPLHVLAVERLLDRDVGHGGRGRSAVPVFVAGGTPDDIAGTNFHDLLARTLCPTAAGGDDERLA
jgi:hypothetical protein